MNRKSANYKFDDITIGLTKEFSIEITESMIIILQNFQETIMNYIWMKIMPQQQNLVKEFVMECY